MYIILVCSFTTSKLGKQFRAIFIAVEMAGNVANKMPFYWRKPVPYFPTAGFF